MILILLSAVEIIASEFEKKSIPVIFIPLEYFPLLFFQSIIDSYDNYKSLFWNKVHFPFESPANILFPSGEYLKEVIFS